MDAFRELFTTSVGLLSAGALAGVVIIGVFMIRWFIRQIEREDAERRDTKG